MPSNLSLTLFFLGWLSVYLFLQLRAKVFLRHYFLTFGAIFATGLGAFAVGFIWLSTKTVFGVIIGALAGCFGLLFLVMSIVKLQVATETRFLKLSKLFRNLTWIETIPVEFSINPDSYTEDNVIRYTVVRNFDTVTDDHVKLRGTVISSGHSRVIVIAHGSFRSRSTMAYVFLAQWLAHKFDVITFDFRGHGESGGYFDFSDSTVQDVKAIVDYARRLGYQKIGLFGRSMGAWSVLMAAAKYGDVDSIVAAASPLGQITTIPMAKKLQELLDLPVLGFGLRFLVKWGISVMRGTHFDGVRDADFCPKDIVHLIAPVPVFFIYQEYDTVIRTRVEDAMKMFEAAGEPKQLLILAGRGHIFEVHQFYRVYQAIEEWFDRTLVV